MTSQEPSAYGFRVWWLTGALLALGAALAWQGVGLRGPAIGPLPREGDTLAVRAFPVGDWAPGANGTIALAFTVSGPGLGDEFSLRFTEGAGRATAQARVEWTDEKGLPVGDPFEKPFKDDC